MVVGKQKKQLRKKGGKKKTADAFARKEWYDVKTPAAFDTRNAGKTPINRTQGTRIASDDMKGRVFEINLGDLKNNNEGYAKVKLICEEVQGKNVLTNFYGMSFTRDKVASLIRKWQTLIESVVDVKTTDGYVLRIFTVGFTKKTKGQTKKSAYAQSAQVRAIRKKMVEIITNTVQKVDLREFVSKHLLPETFKTDIETACKSIFPLQNVNVRKVKMLKSPKFDLMKLMETHEGSAEDAGAKVTRTDEPATVEPAAGAGGRY